MSTKKSRGATKNTTFSDMFARSLHDLFSHDAKYPLLNYDYLGNVPDGLRLVDLDSLKLVNLASLIVGLKYLAVVGVYMFVLGGFGLSYVFISSEENANEMALNNERKDRLASLVEKYEHNNNYSYPVYEYKNKIIVSGNDDIAVNNVLLAAAKVPEPTVLGASVSKISDSDLDISLQEDTNKTVSSCSFTINNERYSSNASYVFDSNSNSVCVNHDGASVDWYVRGFDSVIKSTGECYKLSKSKNDQVLVVNVFDDQSTLVGSCSLNITND